MRHAIFLFVSLLILTENVALSDDSGFGQGPGTCAKAQVQSIVQSSGTEPGSASPSDPDESQQIPTVIGAISFSNKEIFDVDNPKEDKYLFRLANRLHIKTRDSVIRKQLLFGEGDCVTKQEIKESERLLRGNQYLYDADIELDYQSDGVANAVVTTQDVWTLDFGVSASRSGGKNKSGIALKETNLLGTGTSIKIKHRSDVDRSSTKYELANQHLGGSNLAAMVAYANNSDGRFYELDVGRPFYALDTRWAAGAFALDQVRVDEVYNLGEVVDEYRHNNSKFELSYGWSAGLNNGWVTRIEAGIVSSEDTFAATDLSTGLSTLPANRNFTYPFIGFEIIEDRFKTTKNHNQIDRTEDVFLGTRIAGRIGYSSSSFNSSQQAWLGEFEVSRGFGDPSTWALMINAGVSGRSQDSTFRGLLTSASAEMYWRQSKRRLLFASLSTAVGNNLDLDQFLVLGGEDGLRGYPLRYQRGDSRWLLTLEQRFFTDWKPFQLVNVGAAVFFDAGVSSGSEFGSNSDLGVLKDVGFGLRLGNRRSGGGRMIHVDLAFPLDGGEDIDSAQLLISTKQKF